jgi:hypothetical protein
LVADIEEYSEDKDGVVLMTIHSAKGLEFDNVFVVGLEEGLLPHLNSFDSKSDIEEERRLFYVGVTRAKTHLHISFDEVVSRFVAETGLSSYNFIDFKNDYVNYTNERPTFWFNAVTKFLQLLQPNDYEKLRALTKEERDAALGVYVESLLSIGDSFLLDGHYLGLVRGEVNRITGSWIIGFDRLILVSASTDDVWNRINNDERDRSLFPKNLSETEIKEMLKMYQYDTGNEFRRLGELYDKKGFEVLNSENNLDEAVKNLVEYIEKYK